MNIYLDYAATSPLDPRVLKAMEPFLGPSFGNPSSPHSLGEEAKASIERSRVEVSTLIGSEAEEIFFTSGGTESNNWALYSFTLLEEKKKGHLITTTIEHPSVLEVAKFLESIDFEVTYLPVDGKGRVDPEEVRKALKPTTVLVSVMHANNETGVIQPIKEAEIPLHTDAVQTVGHIAVSVEELGVDLLSISAHKLCGPKCVGALFVRHGLNLPPLLRGGGQERGLRSGTENVPGIVGFGKACEVAQEALVKESERIRNLKVKLYEGLMGILRDPYLGFSTLA